MKQIKIVEKCQSIPETELHVYQFLQENYQKINDLSLRTYMKALQLYRDNPDKWKERFMQMVGFDEKVIEYLKLKEMYKTDNERVEKYKWSRRTYFRVKSEVEE